MASVNKVILIGNLGRDPESNTTQGGTSVANFPIATTEKWTDSSGEKKEKTEWHNIVAWGKLAVLVTQYLKKGKSVYVEGKLSTRSWEDESGNKKYKTEVIANTVQFLSKDNQGGNSAPPINDDDLPF